jgi:hypothetical protein
MRIFVVDPGNECQEGRGGWIGEMGILGSAVGYWEDAAKGLGMIG